MIFLSTGMRMSMRTEGEAMNLRRFAAVMITLVAALTLFGCAGSSSRGGSDAPGVQLPPSAAPGPSGAAMRTSISTASEQDLSAALRANNVDDPEHWSKVVILNRPYPKNDPSLGKLRQVLTQFQATPDDTQKIINSLRP